METDLYKPIKKYFENLGYKVNGEVKNCDVTALKDDTLAIIELKTSFNIKLLYQAIDRQKVTNNVYVAIPKPKRREGKNYSMMIHIVKSLGIGLLTVELSKRPAVVDMVAEPEYKEKAKNNRRSRDIIKEVQERTVDLNDGGSTGKKITTAYTEKALRIAVVLKHFGKHKAANLVKNFGCCKNTRQILYGNYYGWFERAGNGIYLLSPKGEEALRDEKYKDFIDMITEDIHGKI